MAKLTGGCLCGAVRFEVVGDAVVSGGCYCRDCQAVAGGGAAYGMMFPAEALTITRGETRRFTSKAASGNDVHRDFCPACGVHLFSHNSGLTAFRAIKVGVLDDPSVFQSQGNVWAASAQPWHRPEPDLPRWDKNPEMALD